MTESEAKKEIEHNVFCNTDNFEITISKECYKTIIKSLKKQVQKKVKYEDVGYDQYNNVNVYACICPSCGLEIIRFNDNDVSDKCESCDTEEMFHSSMVHHAYIGLNNYCNRCGQKLDWSDKEWESEKLTKQRNPISSANIAKRGILMMKKTEDGVAFYRQKRITGTVARILFGGMIFEWLEWWRMSNDLISREKIRDYIKGEINPYGKPFEGTAYELGLKIMRYIDAMDSDYDIDKVVVELETDSSVKLYGSQNSDNYMMPVKRGIEIVKQGSISDDVCEWKVFDNSLTGEPQWVYETTCGKYVGEEHTSKAFVYCPYCSKKIKAVE